MLFDQKEFEYTIEEPELKKGLKLFASNKIEILNKESNRSFTFLIHSKPAGEISLQIRSGKIINYKCSCYSKNYCEHLAAALFYLQKEVVEFIKPVTKNKKKQSKAKKGILENCLSSIKTVLKPFVEIDKLKAQQINEICKKIDIEKEKRVFVKQEFYFHLAIILELPKLSNFNYYERENKLHDLVKNSQQKIKQYLSEKPTVIEKEAVIEAAKYSVRSQANFRGGAFSLLIYYALGFIKDKNDLDLLKGQLKKRTQSKNRQDQTDRKLIAEIQISVLQANFLGKTYSLKEHTNTIELPIALAELEFRESKIGKGFTVLAQYAQQLKTKNINKYLDLISEILGIAKEKNNKKTEIEFLEEKFVFGYVIDETELNYFFDLIGESRKQAADQLLTRLKNESRFYTFDKIALLLMNQNRSNELMEEIKREKNKFRVLNTIAPKIFPDNDFIKLYVKHLAQAITEAKFHYFQQEVFNSARIYLDGLPLEPRTNVVIALKEKMLYDKLMLVYINKFYP
ncbi:MAG: hypothetical protein H0W73_06595 [Bacteroidetes bacterium]|nr:hypothetical protein [Bacteroidota bacterium]